GRAFVDEFRSCRCYHPRTLVRGCICALAPTQSPLWTLRIHGPRSARPGNSALCHTSGPSLWRSSLLEIRSLRPPDTSEESRYTCAHGPAAGVPQCSATPSAAPRRGILLPICAVPGQTAPCAVAWAQTPYDTYSPNWNALTFDTFP